MSEKETKRYEEAKNKDFKTVRDNQIPEPIYDDFTKPESQVKLQVQEIEKKFQ